MIEPIFEKLGFNLSECRVYLGLAELGKSTAQLLARRTGYPRTTVYSVLDNLVTKGLVSIERKGHTTLYTPSKPEALLRLVDQEREALKTKESLARELIELARPYFKSKHFSIPKLQFFEGRRNVENFLYEYFDEWQKSMIATDGVWWGYQDHELVNEYYKWLEHTWKKKTPAERIQLITNVSTIEDKLRDKVSGRENRFIGKGFELSSTIWICGEYVILLMTREEPHYAFQLRDAVFASNLRVIFQRLWELLK